MLAIKQTTQWLKKTVIGLGFCPFAKAPFEEGRIRIANCLEQSDEVRLDFFIDELALLELNLRSDLSTTLIVFSICKEDFLDFNDFCGLCEDYLKESQLESDFQVVVFHPKFYFQDADPSDPTNMVNQSPYPTLHILRNVEIDEASMNYPDVDLIPERNRKKILAMLKKHS